METVTKEWLDEYIKNYELGIYTEADKEKFNNYVDETCDKLLLDVNEYVKNYELGTCNEYKDKQNA